MASSYTDGDCFINIYCLFLYILILLRYFKVRTEVSFSTQEGLLRNTGYSGQRFLCTDYSDWMPNQGESGKNNCFGCKNMLTRVEYKLYNLGASFPLGPQRWEHS